MFFLVASILTSGLAASATPAINLAVTAGLNPDGTASTGTPITLTAKLSDVDLGSGQAVNLCFDSSCVSRFPGSDGTATVTFLPIPGCSTYFADYFDEGTGTLLRAILPQRVSNTGAPLPTTTTLSTPQGFDLPVTVLSVGPAPAPSGSLVATDLSDGGVAPVSVQLTPGISSLHWDACELPHPGAAPQSIAAGDFDGDGNADLAVANAGDSTLTILKGNGDGTFATSSTVALPFVPATVTTGDFRGLGVRDLAVTSWNTAQVLILLSNGDGTFSGGQTLALPDVAAAIATGDFGGAGVDLIVASGISTGSVTEFRGNGDGTFLPGVTTSLSAPGPSSIAITDFGAVVGHLASDATNVATVLVSAGGGTFTEVAPLSIPGVGKFTTPLPITVLSGNFHGAGGGHPDVILANALGATYIGAGAGAFDFSGLRLTFNLRPAAALAADLDGDGQTDVVVSAPAAVQVNLQRGDGFVTSPIEGIWSASGLAAADFDHNGTLDIAASVAQTNLTYTVTSQQQHYSAATVREPIPIGSGLHTIQVDYPGDATHDPSADQLSLTTLPMVTIGGALDPIVLSPGSSASRVLQVSALGVSTGQVRMGCLVGPIANPTASEVDPTCSFEPAFAQISPGNPFTATVTVSTSKQASLLGGLSGSAMAAAALFLSGKRGRKGLLLALCAAASLGVIACLGPHQPGTTPGSYGLRVTAVIGDQTSVIVIPVTVQ
jgi:hypothetical protein